ncbi:uncharacterized protein LOC111591601 [Ceratitis capitata]|nr:uncharacterized protein LOC111591601 [Ceratitis capitata]
MLRGSILVLTLLLTFGYLQALPYYGDNFDDEAEFVPLEQQQHQQQQHQLHQGRAGSPNAREKPFEVDVITSEVNGDNNPPGVFFQQSFPFLGNDFFNSFGGFGFGGIPREHWWKG